MSESASEIGSQSLKGSLQRQPRGEASQRGAQQTFEALLGHFHY